MSKFQIRGVLNSAKNIVGKHSPEILTGIGIAGMITTTILAVKATPKALRICKEVEETYDEPKKLDYVKATWKCYIPAAITGTLSTACLIGASSANLKRNAALATAYQISQTALAEYKEKVVETVGEETEKVIREKVAEEKVKKNPIGPNEVIMIGGEDFYCIDSISGRCFKSNEVEIKRVENEINNRLLNYMYVSLNEFYTEIGLSHTAVGDELGWNIDDGMLEIFITAVKDEKGRPCLVLDYNVAPKYDYSKLM